VGGSALLVFFIQLMIPFFVGLKETSRVSAHFIIFECQNLGVWQ
jgi:hypothetical protein